MKIAHPLRPPSQRRWPFLKWSAWILGVLVFALFCTPPASASMVYAYLGADYSTATGVYTTGDYVSGEFTTLVPLAPNLDFAAFTPSTFAFSDGVFSWTNVNTLLDSFSIVTDGYGTVTEASIDLIPNESAPPWSLLSLAGGPQLVISPTGDLVNATSEGHALTGAAGIWGPDFDPPGGAPEPASAVLTATVLLAFLFRARKRIAQGLRQSAQSWR